MDTNKYNWYKGVQAVSQDFELIVKKKKVLPSNSLQRCFYGYTRVIKASRL